MERYRKDKASKSRENGLINNIVAKGKCVHSRYFYSIRRKFTEAVNVVKEGLFVLRPNVFELNV